MSYWLILAGVAFAISLVCDHHYHLVYQSANIREEKRHNKEHPDKPYKEDPRFILIYMEVSKPDIMNNKIVELMVMKGGYSFHFIAGILLGIFVFGESNSFIWTAVCIGTFIGAYRALSFFNMLYARRRMARYLQYEK